MSKNIIIKTKNTKKDLFKERMKHEMDKRQLEQNELKTDEGNLTYPEYHDREQRLETRQGKEEIRKKEN